MGGADGTEASGTFVGVMRSVANFAQGKPRRVCKAVPRAVAYERRRTLAEKLHRHQILKTITRAALWPLLNSGIRRG
jgi:hypothetical protein